MRDFLEMMAAPVAISLILVAMHGYLGTHVVRRGVIFVDIALAQIVAFGVSLALLLGAEVGSGQAYLTGLVSALLGALLLAGTRTRNRRVPQEAYIGVIYVVFSAAMMLILSNLAHGGEEVTHLLIGSILWVTWPVVLKTLLLYAVLGGVLVWSHSRLILITENPERAQAHGHGLARWDFLFYLVLGIVVTSSVQVAGVLMVFTLLVVPSVMAIRLFSDTRRQGAWLLFVGTLCVVIGATLSYVLDLPTGSAIVCTFGLMMGLQILVESLVRK